MLTKVWIPQAAALFGAQETRWACWITCRYVLNPTQNGMNEDTLLLIHQKHNVKLCRHFSRKLTDTDGYLHFRSHQWPSTHEIRTHYIKWMFERAERITVKDDNSLREEKKHLHDVLNANSYSGLMSVVQQLQERGMTRGNGTGCPRPLSLSLMLQVSANR